MPIYTKKGDTGQTALPGKKVSKSDCLIEALGNLDELNSFLGFVAALSGRNYLKKILPKIQNHIFLIQAEVASQDQTTSKPSFSYISEKNVLSLEKAIDKIEELLSPINKFILPQGARDSAALHVARTICRKTERALVRVNLEKPFENPNILKYINRLSDFLFVLARFSNKINNISDIHPDYYNQYK